MPVAPRSLGYSESCVISATSEFSRDFQHGLTVSNFACKVWFFRSMKITQRLKNPMQSNVFYYSVDMTRGLGEGIRELHFNARHL